MIISDVNASGLLRGRLKATLCFAFSAVLFFIILQ